MAALENLGSMRRERRYIGAYESTICHYCGERADTEDHIVPRALLPKPMSQIPYWFRANNTVPACFACNSDKGMFRSDCTCDHCTWAWKAACALFIVRRDFDYDRWPVAAIVRSPG